MRWPWVSSAWKDRALAAEERLVAKDDALTALVHSLKDDVVSMRREGFNPAPVEPSIEPRSSVLTAAIVDMIGRRAPNEGEKMRLKRWAKNQIEAGRTPEDVLADIRDGQE